MAVHMTVTGLPARSSSNPTSPVPTRRVVVGP